MGCEGYSWCICDIESGLSVCLRAVKLEYPQQQVSEVRSSYNQFRLCTLADMKLPTEKLTVCFSYKENDRKQKIKKKHASQKQKNVPLQWFKITTQKHQFPHLTQTHTIWQQQNLILQQQFGTQSWTVVLYMKEKIWFKPKINNRLIIVEDSHGIACFLE